MIFSDKRFFAVLGTYALLLLAAVSVCCAFLGADRASAVFNSMFAGVCWSVLGLLLFCAGAWNIIRRRKIFVAVAHLGCAAVILGGLLGSERVCQWRGLSPARAWASLHQGQAAKLGSVVMRLRNINAEYYPIANSMLAWRIYFETHLADGSAELTPVRNVDNMLLPVNGFVVPGRDIMCEKFDWIVADSFNIPQLIWPDDNGWNREQLLMEQPVNILTGMFFQRSAIVKNFYDNLRFDVDSKGKPAAVNSDEGRKNPAVYLVDSQGKPVYILSPGETVRMGLFAQDGRMLMYMPVNVNRGGRGGPFAAILRLRKGAEVMTGVTAACEDDLTLRLSLEPLYATKQLWVADGRPSLFFRLEQPEKQVFADSIFDDNTKLRIGVNSPVSYGGYDFAIVGYDLEKGSVEICARRNCGLLWVWSGFALLGVGLVGWCVVGLLKSRRAAA